VLAATIRGTRGFIKILILIALSYWGALLLVSLPPTNLPDFVTAALIASGLPLFATLGLVLWNQGSRNATALAFRDDLTDLANRRAFRVLTAERLHQSKAGTLAMILIDVDHLKLVNDECGHLAGDELLVLLSRQLQRIAPDPELVFRFGGDEFAILVDRATGQSAADVIAELGPFESDFVSCGHEHAVHISYGFVSNQAEETFDSFFSRADQRLRDFKRRIISASGLRQAGGAFGPAPEGADEREGKISSINDRRLVRRRATP
jgi:diguanylate cyclase (GGDEF)-like protein